MIELGRPTGNFEEECIEVELADRRIIYASPVYPHGFMFAPTSAWINKYKDEIYLILLQDRNQYYCIGYNPRVNNYSDATDFPQEGHFRTEKFIIKINDETEEFTIEQREGAKQKIVLTSDSTYVKSDKIYLTSASADEPCLLGNKTEDLLKDILDYLVNLYTDLGKVNVAIPTHVSDPTTVTDVAAKVPELQQLKAAIAQIKSTKVKLA